MYVHCCTYVDVISTSTVISLYLLDTRERAVPITCGGVAIFRMFLPIFLKTFCARSGVTHQQTTRNDAVYLFA